MVHLEGKPLCYNTRLALSALLIIEVGPSGSAPQLFLHRDENNTVAANSSCLVSISLQSACNRNQFIVATHENESLDFRGTDIKMQQGHVAVVIAFIALYWFQGGFCIAPFGDEPGDFLGIPLPGEKPNWLLSQKM